MPSHLLPARNRTVSHETQFNDDQKEEDEASHVVLNRGVEDDVAELHRTLTEKPITRKPTQIDPVFADFEQYLRQDDASISQPTNLSVCFKSVTTYGRAGGVAKVKTLRDAIWRTLTLQDVYEATLKKIIAPERLERGQALIRDFSGVVNTGEIML